MACFVNVLAVLLVVFGSTVSCQKELEIGRDDNIEPFSLLCRIYNVAKNPPINYVDLLEADKIVEEIDALNASLVEPKSVNETEPMENSVGAQLRHTTTREAALLQISLNQITQRAHKILEDIRKINVTKEIEKAKAEFNKVIFGEDGNESNLCHATVKGMDNRSDVCGKPGQGSRGNGAGKNLVVDFFCLCAQRTESSEGAKQACGFHVGRIDKHYGWGEQGPWGSSTMWASIKGGCGKHMQRHPKSTAEARHILDQFLKHLRTGGVYRQIKCEKDRNNCKDAIVEGSHRKVGMLGTGVTVSEGSAINCDGKEGGKEGKRNGNVNPGGVCVYYGSESNSWEENIEWLKQFKTALTSVDTANNQTATIQRSIQKLQMLQQRVEEISETAKVISEIKYPIRLASLFQNASGNLTAHNATRIRSYSYNPNLYFIPLCVLLLQ
ncbi:Variant surface glycoprotein [Trypanosoma congolense IL3000]|uniref:Variant surface glycoprotein n=1 Tax=Trypanosoma congolense (strain IL3000) TaxID=1068625 RepID=F9WG41_TRYCI|nr:Variant surface glycoprotein [Trypanosoma congolense IL3000]